MYQLYNKLQMNSRKIIVYIKNITIKTRFWNNFAADRMIQPIRQSAPFPKKGYFTILIFDRLIHKNIQDP